MIILLFFSFVSGLVTIFAPCIWPLLPIILSSTTVSGKLRPLGITLGIMVSFAFFTLTISYIVKIIPFDPDILRLFAVAIITFLGLTLLIPTLTQILEGWVSRFSGRIGSKISSQGNGFRSGFITGAALGIVWSPCAGPILATIATLAATQKLNFGTVLITFAYVLGVGIPLLIFSTFGQWIFTRTRAFSRYTGRIQQIFGVIMILTAVAIFTNYDKVLQAKLLDIFPAYSTFLYKLESDEKVKEQLDMLKKKKEDMRKEIKDMNSTKMTTRNFGPAPEFVGIAKWLNSSPLTMKGLRGKVVLIDFWTYTCINCIRTLPYVTKWYEKYKDQGLVVIGVHTPEFEFEKKTENVKNAIKQYNILYPVAQDNDYATWRAYDNQYWPAKYLIDAKGIIRYIHFGEGQYEETEKAIQELLREAGKSVNAETTKAEEEFYMNYLTPETYIGWKREERNESFNDITNGYFVFPEKLSEHAFALQGEWKSDDKGEYRESGRNAQLQMRFIANKVFLVITPRKAGDKIKVFLDDEIISEEVSGADVKNGEVTLDVSRLYHFVDFHGEGGSHILKLEFESDGTQIFAFTFG